MTAPLQAIIEEMRADTEWLKRNDVGGISVERMEQFITRLAALLDGATERKPMDEWMGLSENIIVVPKSARQQDAKGGDAYAVDRNQLPRNHAQAEGGVTHPPTNTSGQQDAREKAQAERAEAEEIFQQCYTDMGVELLHHIRKAEAAEAAVLALTAQLDKAQQDREAQFAHNTSLLKHIQELQRDNDMMTDYLAKIEGIVNGTGSDGHIVWDLDKRIRDLVGPPAPSPNTEAVAHLKGQP